MSVAFPREIRNGRVVVSRRGGATLLIYPPPGLHRSVVGYLATGGALLVASLALLVVLVWSGFLTIGINPWAPPDSATAAACWLFLFLSWGGGGLSVVAALVLMRRRATLIACDGGLRIEESGLFREKVYEWPPGAIRSVTAGRRSLKIGLTEGGHSSWPAPPPPEGDVSEAEMRWLASELRRALGLADRE